MNELFERHHIRRVKLGCVDIDGTLRGKYVSLDKFHSSPKLGFCDVVFGWDIADALYDNARFTGWHTGFPDVLCSVDHDTFRAIPWEPGTAFFLLDVETDISPRRILRRVLERTEYTPYFAAEYEFFLFRETPESLREKNFRNLTALTPGMFGYSLLRASRNSGMALELFDQLAAFSIPLEGLHTETGPGVYEAAITVDHALSAADRAALFKTATKEILAKHGVIPTFMAKVSPDLPGSSGHLHQSLWKGGENLFIPGPEGLMGSYIAGLVEFIPELMALFCPTVNSYKRTVPGAWAPINATWGIDNRTTAVRAIPSTGKGARVELRLTGADMNPYLAMAASLAAGLEGVARGLKPTPPTTEGYHASAPPLPRSLVEATALLARSTIARDWLGEAFVDHYVSTRDWECRQFGKAVTDWELARYLNPFDMLSTFSFPTKIRFGAGAIGELPQYATRRPLLITDAGLRNTPIFQHVMALLPNAAVFSGVLPNPTEQNVFDGVAAYHDNRCDGIVGLGGGSPLDAAKAIRLKVTHPLSLAEYDDLIGGDAHITPDLPPYIAIATTSGTGSEVSRSTVITLAATNRKTVIFSPHLLPTLAIADPELTLALPPHLTAGTGMDALTHNVEAYLSKGFHPICDAIAVAGTKLAWENLPKVMVHPQNLEARSNMMMASLMGAVAFQKGLGAVHSLAHPLSSDCGMHHGTSNAVLLPFVIEYNQPVVADRLADLFGQRDAADQVREFNAQLNIAPRLRDYGVTEEILPALADKAIQDGCHQLNPGHVHARICSPFITWHTESALL